MLGSKSVQFLGMADHFQPGKQPFPFGGVDLFQLAQHKSHVVYPGIISGQTWILLVGTTFLRSADLSRWKIRIVHEDGHEVGNSLVNDLSKIPAAELAARLKGADARPNSSQSQTEIYFQEGADFVLFPITLANTVVNKPGKCTIQSIYGDDVEEIGVVQFHYQPTPSFTADQIKAIEADPLARRTVQYALGCKLCPAKLHTYAGLSRSSRLEKEGHIWYADLPDEWTCKCGRSTIALRYIRESGHGMLLLDEAFARPGMSYARRYSHAQIRNIGTTFTALLDSTSFEGPIQEFIEKNLVLLAKFNAKQLFVKPSFLGKHVADFAALDHQGIFWLIEIERPSLDLFRKKDGHPTAELMHAYNQVIDWIHQYQKHSAAVIDVLGLKSDVVTTVKGVVVAGRSTTVSHDKLVRHLQNPPYANVEFMTLDDLAASMMNLSARLS